MSKRKVQPAESIARDITGVGRPLDSQDRAVLGRWLYTGASLHEVDTCHEVGLVGNVRFTQAAARAFRWIWTWSAHRHGSTAGRRQDRVWAKVSDRALARGDKNPSEQAAAALQRRFDRANRIAARLRTEYRDSTSSNVYLGGA